MQTGEFQDLIWHKSRALYRSMPWREDTRPYYVLVSELMLQQTQVQRVIPKFEAFIKAFPQLEDLAEASLADVLRLWSGLGYNRRAKYLWEAARYVVLERGGVFPSTPEDLKKLPGVGENTAGAIMAYSFNKPVVFVETNVRTVYFYHFFEAANQVTDAQIREKVAETVDQEHPREWYWALMDYGSFLKRQGVGMNNKSTHYTRQSPLKGSVREVRGKIIAALAVSDAREADVRVAVAADERFEAALAGLQKDGLVTQTNERLHLTR